MNKIKYVLGLIGVLALSTGVAQAQNIKPYVGVGAGVYGLSVSIPGFGYPGLNQKNSVMGGYVDAGVDFNKYFGLELRVGTTGKGSQSHAPTTFGLNYLGLTTPFTTTLQANYLVSYLAKIQYPVSNSFNIHALVGATTAHLKASFSDPSITAAGSATKTGFSYGLGADYNINNQFSVGAEWMQYWNNVNVDVVSKVSIWGATANISYHF